MQPAVATVPGSGVVELIEIKPRGAPGPGQARLRMARVGICGTDRHIAAGSVGEAPEGHRYLVMGHEALGWVEALGEGVSGLEPGDLVMPMVRQGCRACAPCLAGEADMCRSGRYREHGILRLDGFLTTHALVEAERLVRVPPELGLGAIVAESFGTPQKSLDVALRAQQRVDHPCPHPEHGWDQPGWAGCKTALVVGLGPIGLLMALKLRLEGVQTWVLGRRDPERPQPRWVRALGAEYLDLRETDWAALPRLLPDLDLVFDMTGSPDVALRLPALLGANGCLVLVGLPGGQGQWTLDHHTFLRDLASKNQALVGVDNSKRRHLEQAMRDLLRARERYGDLAEQLTTHRYRLDQFQAALGPPEPDQVKVVVDL